MNYKIGDTITFNDGKVYQVLQLRKQKDTLYLLLTYKNSNDEDAFIILKEKYENGKYYLVNLDSEIEFTAALKLLTSKN